ncbi:MAG: HAMP domain-containing protein [Anaerolineales bacterium]|nr:HAMP domain-containing protein [Anaerolineales bacterium]
MSLEITLFSNSFYIEQPQGIVGWIGWVALLGLTVLLLWRWQLYNKRWGSAQWVAFIVLLFLLPLTNLFLIVRLPASGAMPPPDTLVDPQGPAWVVFAALPWVLAAGLLGAAPAAVFGMISGVLLGLWETHSPFTLLEFALLAAVLGAAFQQRYRTVSFRLLRQPLFTTLLLAVIYPLLLGVNTLLVTGGDLASRVDYALTRAQYDSLAVGAELLLAGLIAQIVSWMLPGLWVTHEPLKPSPAETRLQTRLMTSIAPLVLMLIIALVLGDWIVAGSAARGMLRDRMSSSAEIAVESLPYFMATGQGLIQRIASDPVWIEGSLADKDALLEESLRVVPFFNQLFLLDNLGQPISGYPVPDFYMAAVSAEERSAIDLALSGVPFQSYTIPPVDAGTAAWVSYIALVQDQVGMSHGILIGRSDLSINPFTKPALTSLASLANVEGEGILLDKDGRILYHSQGMGVMQLYLGKTTEQADFFDDTGSDGTRRLVYSQPVQGMPWRVVISVPARQAQQLALQIAAPLLGMIAAAFLISAVLLYFALRFVTASLRNLALEANRISGGDLAHPLVVRGEDEVGRLSAAFEHMRSTLKERLDELNRLLVVSQGVASSLEISEAVQPVLDSALGTGACSARVVLSPEAVPETDGSTLPATRFWSGSSAEVYASLDEQVMGLTRRQERLILTNFTRTHVLNFAPTMPPPAAILSLPLRHENLYYGILWLVYDKPHRFGDDELRFLTTLAGQAALAAANARLFSNAEIGRQRLAAILDSTPDPVLVTDHLNRVLLTNPAAWQVLGLQVGAGEGRPIEEVTQLADLVRLLRTFSEERMSAEIGLPDGKIYLATASTVKAEGRLVGRVCILRDITHFKELDALKSEFVATVSHDLRSPLTLMRGYATMLEMVGALNEQQVGYVRKIVASVESMTRLVTTLLDLGRIEAGVDLQLEMVPVHDVVERVTGALQLQATQKQLSLSVEFAPQTTPLVEADHALLQQALHNLLENAIKYTPSGGKVTLRVSPRQDRLLFEVSDTGIGIAPVDLPRLFEKFYRTGNKDAKKQSGTGLGLAIVRSIAERHSGRVWVESQLGKGSTFYFAIPFRQEEEK